MEVPVAVVGNGPVGQTAALLLARWGVPSTLLDARPRRDAVGSKAIVQQRDVLDVWESVGAGRRITAEGLTWTTARTFHRDRELFGYTFAEAGRPAFPPFVNISQSRTERLLDESIAAAPPVDYDDRREAASGARDARIRAVIGDRPYEVVWGSVYRFHSRVVDRMRIGRVLLAGDVAHLVSPFGARGLNSGVQDAENAAWKLAFTLNGWAGGDLLDSYHAERHATRAPVRLLRLADVDRTGALARALTARPGEVWLIRPDAHIAAVLADPTPPAVTAAVRRALALHTPAAS